MGMYEIAKIIHIYCAIIFVGYLFFDVVVFDLVKKRLGESAQKVSNEISKITSNIMPLTVFVLILTGGMMMTRWVNSQIGYFQTTLQQLFMLKVILAFVIFIAICINQFFKRVLKTKGPLGNIHYFALLASFIIILIAKIMFFV